MLIGQLADALIPVVGLPALFRAFAVVIAVVLALGSPFVRLPGADVVCPRLSPPPRWRASGTTPPARWSAGPPSGSFSFGTCSCAPPACWSSTPRASIAAYYGAAAVLGLLLSVFNGLSRIPFGVLVDKFGRRKVMLLANGFLLLSGALLVLGGVSRSAVLVLAGMLIMGVCYGNSVTIGTLVIRQFYGSAHYATNLAIVNCCAIPASFIGPLISSALQTASGGDYTTTFVCVLVFAVADLLVGFLVKKP